MAVIAVARRPAQPLGARRRVLIARLQHVFHSLGEVPVQQLQLRRKFLVHLSRHVGPQRVAARVQIPKFIARQPPRRIAAHHGRALVLALVERARMPDPRILHKDRARRRRDLKFPRDRRVLVDAVVGAARVARVFVRSRHDPGAAVKRGHILRTQIPHRRQRHADIGKGLGDRATVLPRLLVARPVRRQVMRPVGMPAAPPQLFGGDRLLGRPRRLVDLGLHNANVRVERGPGHFEHARLGQVLGKDLAPRDIADFGVWR